MYGTARATSATAVGGTGLTRTATARRIARSDHPPASAAVIKEDAGHSINLHPDAPGWFTAASVTRQILCTAAP